MVLEKGDHSVFDTAQNETMALIEFLHEGEMLKHPLLKRYVDRSIHTGNGAELHAFVERHPQFVAMAQRNIALTRYQRLTNPYRPYPRHDEVLAHLTGPIQLGYVNSLSDMFGLHWDVLSLPLIMPGRVRSGKSQLMKYLLCQICRTPRPFNVLVFDLKREYRHLVAIARYLKVLTSDHLRINPLQVPPWMTPQVYSMFFSDVFVKENWLATTSKNFILLALEDLYKKRGVYDGSQNYPIMKDLYNYISHQLHTDRSFRYRDLLLWIQNRLWPYCLSEVFNCRIGIPYEIWRTENLVVEMDKGFTDEIYRFLVSYIAGLNYTYNMEMGLIGTILRTLLPLDEGRILAAPHRDLSVFGESYFNQLTTKTAEFGIGYILASQETASFNQTLRSISYTKICFPLTDGSDKDFLQESFGLDDEQANYVFKLPRFGQAIVRYGGYEKPFLLAVPQFRVKKHLTNEELDMRMAPFYRELKEAIKPAARPAAAFSIESVPPVAATLLYFLGKNSFTKVSDMTAAPGFKSPEEVGKALAWLETHGFVVREKYRTSKVGRRSVFAIFTDKAYAYLGVKGPPGKGDTEHKLGQHLIYEKQRKAGEHAEIEGRIKGHPKGIDVLIYSKEHGYRAFEVTLHFETLLTNIHRDIEAGASEVVIVTRDRKSLERAMTIVRNDQSLTVHLERITFRTIDEFFD